MDKVKRYKKLLKVKEDEWLKELHKPRGKFNKLILTEKGWEVWKIWRKYLFVSGRITLNQEGVSQRREMKLRYKFLNKGFKSSNGDEKWKMGKWKTFKGELSMCNAGFHCSKKPYEAFSYVQGPILARVEVKGRHLSDDDKECWEKMRIVKAWKWTKKDSVSLAIYAAKLVLPIFEKEYPDDKIPREAIEAAIKYLKNPSKKNRMAAGAAADAAWAAGAAARTAAGAAADTAARAADTAADTAAREAIIRKISTWFDKRVKGLERKKR